MNIQGIIGLFIMGILLAVTIAFGIKRDVFQNWWYTWLSWDWYTRIAVVMIALGSAAVLTFGIH